MKTSVLACAILILLVASLRAEVYRVTVTRIDKDLYRVEDVRPVVYIETKYCYQYATRDDAVLRYERYSYNNTLIFSDRSSCDVKALR